MAGTDGMTSTFPSLDFISLANYSRSLISRQLENDSYATSSSSNPQPLLSPSAEAELYLLATNFLLYIALVIMTTLIAKVYFPESLDPTLRKQPEASSTSIKEDEEQQASLLGNNDDADAAEMEYRSDLAKSLSTSRNRRISFDIEFDQKQTPRLLVLRRLLFCSLMLNLTFVIWGVLQERMLTRRYPRVTGEYFTYSYALVFSNRLWTFLMASALLLYVQPQRSRSVVLYEYSFTSVSNLLSSWCQYEALRYVSFPSTTLFKSFKLAPVMVMGKILGNKECKLCYAHFKVLYIRQCMKTHFILP